MDETDEDGLIPLVGEEVVPKGMMIPTAERVVPVGRGSVPADSVLDYQAMVSGERAPTIWSLCLRVFWPANIVAIVTVFAAGVMAILILAVGVWVGCFGLPISLVSLVLVALQLSHLGLVAGHMGPGNEECLPTLGRTWEIADDVLVPFGITLILGVCCCGPAIAGPGCIVAGGMGFDCGRAAGDGWYSDGAGGHDSWDLRYRNCER